MISNQTEAPSLIDVEDGLNRLKRRLEILADALGNETCHTEACAMFLDELVANNLKEIQGMLATIRQA